MRYRSSYPDEDGNMTGGTRVVGQLTEEVIKNPHMLLFLRESGARVTSGEIFLFSVNPRRIRYEQDAKVALQQTRYSYLISQSGLGAPMWTLSGTFGFRSRRIKLPPLLGPFLLKTVRYVNNQGLADFNNPDIFAFLGVSGTRDFEAANGGNLTDAAAFEQNLDGREAWIALRDFCKYYFEENVRRTRQGKPQLEMVWLDVLHTNRWCVVPKGLPSLERTVETQGTHPYTLELLGVYDDARPRPQVEEPLW